MNEFAVGAKLVGPVGEFGGCAGLNDSFTVGSVLDFTGTVWFDPVLLGLVGIALKD